MTVRIAERLLTLVEVVDRTGISRTTLRAYERAGLIDSPFKDEEGLSYGETVVDRVLRIERLRRDLGVNLAGVQVILEMRDRIEYLNGALEELVRFVNEEMGEELSRHRERLGGRIPGSLSGPPDKD